MSGTRPSFSSVKIGTSVSSPTPTCMKRIGPTQSKKLPIFNRHEGLQDRMRCHSYPQSSPPMLRWLNRKTIALQCGQQNDRGRLECKGKNADLVFLSRRIHLEAFRAKRLAVPPTAETQTWRSGQRPKALGGRSYSDRLRCSPLAARILEEMAGESGVHPRRAGFGPRTETCQFFNSSILESLGGLGFAKQHITSESESLKSWQGGQSSRHCCHMCLESHAQ